MTKLSLLELRKFKFKTNKIKSVVMEALKELFPNDIPWKEVFRDLENQPGFGFSKTSWDNFKENAVANPPRGGRGHFLVLVYWLYHGTSKDVSAEECRAVADRICINFFGTMIDDYYNNHVKRSVVENSNVTDTLLNQPEPTSTARTDNNYMAENTPIKKIHQRFSRNILGAVGLSVVFISVVIAWGVYSNFDIFESQPDRSNKQSFQSAGDAWNFLLKPVGGDTGKGEAVNFIIQSQGKIENIDLSCKAIGDWENGKCVRAPILKNINLSDGLFWSNDETQNESYGFKEKEKQIKEQYRYLENVDLSNTDIRNLRAEHFDFDKVKLEFATGRNWIIRNPTTSRFNLSIDNFSCYGCFIYGGEISWNYMTMLDYGYLSNTALEYPILEIRKIQNKKDKIFWLSPDNFLEDLSTFTDAPVIIFNQPKSYNLNERHYKYEPSLFDFNKDIPWNIYQKMQYCVPEEDFDKVIHQTKDLDGKDPPFYAGDGFPIPRSNLNNKNYPQLTLIDYHCGLVFDEIKHIIKPRIIDRIRNEFHIVNR